jgi:hypothetical protein
MGPRTMLSPHRTGTVVTLGLHLPPATAAAKMMPHISTELHNRLRPGPTDQPFDYLSNLQLRLPSSVQVCWTCHSRAARS